MASVSLAPTTTHRTRCCGIILATALSWSIALAQAAPAPAGSTESDTGSANVVAIQNATDPKQTPATAELKNSTRPLLARSILSSELTISPADTLRATIADAGSHLRAPGAAPKARIVLRDETGAILHSRLQPIAPDDPTTLRLASRLEPKAESNPADQPTTKHRVRLEVLIDQVDIERIDRCPMTLTLSAGDQADDASNTCGSDPCCDDCGPFGSSGVYPSCSSMDWFEY